MNGLMIIGKHKIRVRFEDSRQKILYLKYIVRKKL